MAFKVIVMILLLHWCVVVHVQIICGNRAGGTGPCPPGYKRDVPEQHASIDDSAEKFTDPPVARRNKATRDLFMQMKRQLFENEEWKAVFGVVFKGQTWTYCQTSSVVDCSNKIDHDGNEIKIGIMTRHDSTDYSSSDELYSLSLHSHGKCRIFVLTATVNPDTNCNTPIKRFCLGHCINHSS